MENGISNIRINDWFWIKFGNGFISFGYKGLPDDIHLTLSLSEKADDYNIHLTRNVGSDPANKPKIEIVRINKKVIEKIGPYSALNLIYKFLKPLDIKAVLNNDQEDAKFVSIESLETGANAKVIEGYILDGFKPISKLKSKGRFRIEGQVESAFEKVLQNEHYLTSMMDTCVTFRDAVSTTTKGGMLMHDHKAMAVLQINNEWFEFHPEIKPFDLLASVVGEEWASIISEHFSISLARIANANTFEETRAWNNPITLVANPDFERSIDDLQKSSS